MYTSIISSQGQISIPKPLREKAGLATNSTILYELDEKTGNIIIKRPPTLKQIRTKNKKHIKPGTPPLTDFRQWYEANWRPE